jgi:DNA-binding transcriptional MerR regulator
MSLTKREIFERLKKEGVDLGENPFRKFLYYQETGLIPEPEGKVKNALLFPEKTVLYIKLIYKLQLDGISISEIKKNYIDVMIKFEKSLGIEKAKALGLLYDAFKNEIELQNNVKSIHDMDDETVKEIISEKYGNLVKDLAIRKLITKGTILEKDDINCALVAKKKTA